MQVFPVVFKRSVLDLSAVELIFVIAANMVPWFLFLTKTMLITENSGDNTHPVLSVAEQCLPSIKATSVSCSAQPFSGGCKRLGGGTARTADPSRPEGHLRLCSAMVSSKKRVERVGWVVIAKGVPGHQSACGR